jgi:formamidopyrimidine-DNA glycosylase
MPELPEVETTRRHLAPALEGRRIVDAVLRRDRMARRNARPGDVAERLRGREVHRVGRVGKFILIDVEGDLTWVIHLGMSGRVRVVDPSEPLDPHTHLSVTTDEGVEVRLVDPRTFGFVAVFTPEELAADSIAALGPDALDEPRTADDLGGVLAGRTAPIKNLLMDQRVIAGLGNIYVDEILHRAGVRPTRPAGELTPDEVASIVTGIPGVLAAGIQMGGTSLDDLAYLLPDGRAGEYLDRLLVYGRTDLPCLTCGTPIQRVVVGQRSSHFCPVCQT